MQISKPEKIIFPEAGITKAEVFEYYELVGERILKFIGNRPVSLVRSPGGLKDGIFYQRHPSESFPEYIERVKLDAKSGSGLYILIDSMEDIYYLLNIGVIEFHVWGASADSIEKPLEIVLDLDPDPDLEWDKIADLAKKMHEDLAMQNLKSFIKTTGGKGVHIHIPLSGENTWDEVKNFAKSIAEKYASESPEFYIAEVSKEKRKGKIFIDYLRNYKSATNVAPYSLRARTIAPVATPINWDEVSEIRPDRYNIRNIAKRLSHLKNDPWEEYFETCQSV